MSHIYVQPHPNWGGQDGSRLMIMRVINYLVIKSTAKKTNDVSTDRQSFSSSFVSSSKKVAHIIYTIIKDGNFV